MGIRVAIVSPDDSWRRSLNEALHERGFHLVWSDARLVGCQVIPDTILLDVSCDGEDLENQVCHFTERYPLCEWILFFATQTCFQKTGLLAHTACFDILPKSTPPDQVSICILAACMRKQQAEERLGVLNGTRHPDPKRCKP